VKKESWFDASLWNAAEREAYERGDPVWYGEYYGKGLLQITGPWIAGVPTPDTFEWEFNMPPEANWNLAPELFDAYNGTQNLDRGSWYLKALYDHYDGDKHKIGSAYRWGWQPVDSFLRGEGGVDPYNNGYITEVIDFRTEYMNNVGLTEEELRDLIDSQSGGLEICPPMVEDVRLNDTPGTINENPGTPVFVTARIDDTSKGMSNITSANYTIGAANWASSTSMNPADSSFDSPMEDVTNAPTPIDTSLLGTGIHVICVYASDEMGNNNTTGSCQTLIVTLELTEPAITGFAINGASALTILQSVPPADLVLNAFVDDTGRGDSAIAGANFTLNGDWAGAQAMNPTDGDYDEINESVSKTVAVPSAPGIHTYCVHGWDVWNNMNTTGQCVQVTIADDVLPTVGATDAPDPQLAGLMVFFNATVTDNIGVGSVWIDIPGEGNFSMTFNPASGQWEHTHVFVTAGSYSYTVWASDTSGNWASAVGAVTMNDPPADSTPPTVLSVTDSPDPQLVGGTVDFMAVITDNVGVSGASLDIAGEGNFTMTYNPMSGQWEFAHVFAASGTYSYNVWASDIAGNLASGSGSVTIDDLPPPPPDTTPPTILSATDSPDPQLTGGTVDFKAVVADNIAVSGVSVDITGEGNFSMSFNPASAQWEHSHIFATAGIYSYDVWASDTSGNMATTSGSVTINDIPPPPIDTTPPSILSATDSPDPQMVGGSVDFRAVVTDNVAISDVSLDIPGEGNFSMTYNGAIGQWEVAHVFVTEGVFAWKVWASDTSGNMAVTSGTVTIDPVSIDTTPPIILSASDEPDPQLVGGIVWFNSTVTDNIGINGVWLNIAGEGNFSMSFDPESGQATASYVFPIAGAYNYKVWASDFLMIRRPPRSTLRATLFPYTTPPTVDSVGAEPSIQKLGLTVVIWASVNDDTSVNFVMVEIRDKHGNVIGNFTMTFNSETGRWEKSRSFISIGSHTFEVWACDDAGNWASSSGSVFIVSSNAKGKFKGKVVDKSSNPIQGATIRVLDAKGSLVAVTTSELDGTYSVSEISPGTYTVEISKDGYAMDIEDEMVVGPGENQDRGVTVLDPSEQNDASGYIMWLVLGIVSAMILLFFVFRRRRKKAADEFIPDNSTYLEESIYD
jgi:hypothetical protein